MRHPPCGVHTFVVRLVTRLNAEVKALNVQFYKWQYQLVLDQLPDDPAGRREGEGRREGVCPSGAEYQDLHCLPRWTDLVISSPLASTTVPPSEAGKEEEVHLKGQHSRAQHTPQQVAATCHCLQAQPQPSLAIPALSMRVGLSRVQTFYLCCHFSGGLQQIKELHSPS